MTAHCLESSVFDSLFFQIDKALDGHLDRFVDAPLGVEKRFIFSLGDHVQLRGGGTQLTNAEISTYWSIVMNRVEYVTYIRSLF